MLVTNYPKQTGRYGVETGSRPFVNVASRVVERQPQTVHQRGGDGEIGGERSRHVLEPPVYPDFGRHGVSTRYSIINKNNWNIFIDTYQICQQKGITETQE